LQCDQANTMNREDSEAVKALEEQLSEAESIRDNLVQECQDYRAQLQNASTSADDNDQTVMDLVVERDDLQRELNQLTDEIDIVQKEIEKVPLLELEIQRLTKVSKQNKISGRQQHMINITAPGNEASLRHKVQLLSDRITSMISLSKFDLESAQELVEVKQQKLDAECRFEELSKKYDDLLK